MAGIRCVHCNRREAGHCHIPHTHVVCLYFLPHTRLTAHRLFCTRILDEYKKIYFICEKKSGEVSVGAYRLLF